jgi:protoheme IX farnesyltransferase
MRAESGLDSLLRRTLAIAIDFFWLTKPKLLSLVLFTTFVGFYAGVRGPLPLELLLHTLIGTALMAGGTTAFNMYRERDLDALMQRTALRPLATGRMPSSQALIFALAISSGGFIYLFLFVNPLASLLSAIIFASYIFLYTPLKTRTWLSIFVGAVPGALPVILGWTAANASISLGACILFLIVFFWQIPHFFAIGWLHRDDYLRASLRVMPAIDRDGRKTSRLALGFIVALLILSLVPFFAGLAGPVYVGGAVLLGMIFLAYAIHFARRRDALAARRLFAASAFYLPLLLVLLTLSKTSL